MSIQYDTYIYNHIYIYIHICLCIANTAIENHNVLISMGHFHSYVQLPEAGSPHFAGLVNGKLSEKDQKAMDFLNMFEPNMEFPGIFC